MSYEVATHKSREEFQEHLNNLKPNQQLHSFQWEAPHILAVYVTVKGA